MSIFLAFGENSKTTDFFYNFVYTLSERGFANHWNGRLCEMQISKLLNFLLKWMSMYITIQVRGNCQSSSL